MASDAARMRELYEREYPRLVRALLAIGGSAEAAEDAAQEAFIKAFRHGLARIERPSAWLLTVGSRELFRDRRRVRREEALPEIEPPGQGSPFEAAVADRAELLAALRKLPERQRAVVVARFYYDLSYAEIARAFDITSGTVGATLSQALANLRQWQLAGKLAREASR